MFDRLSFRSYRAIFRALERLYERYDTDELGALLGVMQLEEGDLLPFDPAFQNEYADLANGVGETEFALLTSILTHRAAALSPPSPEFLALIAELKDSGSEQYRLAREVWEKEMGAEG